MGIIIQLDVFQNQLLRCRTPRSVNAKASGCGNEILSSALCGGYE